MRSSDITYSTLERALNELTIEQIKAVDEEIKTKHPEHHCYRYMCARAIDKKLEEETKMDFLNIIENVKKTKQVFHTYIEVEF